MRTKKVGETIPYPHPLCEDARYLPNTKVSENGRNTLRRGQSMGYLSVFAEIPLMQFEHNYLGINSMDEFERPEHILGVELTNSELRRG